LSLDWLKFFREVIGDCLEHARNGLLHSGITTLFVGSSKPGERPW
jgi:hypothetical protein